MFRKVIDMQEDTIKQLKERNARAEDMLNTRQTRIEQKDTMILDMKGKLTCKNK